MKAMVARARQSPRTSPRTEPDRQMQPMPIQTAAGPSTTTRVVDGTVQAKPVMTSTASMTDDMQQDHDEDVLDQVHARIIHDFTRVCDQVHLLMIQEGDEDDEHVDQPPASCRGAGIPYPRRCQCGLWTNGDQQLRSHQTRTRRCRPRSDLKPIDPRWPDAHCTCCEDCRSRR